MKTTLLTFLRSDRSLWLIPIGAGLYLILGALLFRKPLDTRQARNWDQMRHDLTGETNHETEKMIQYYYQPTPLTWGGNPTNASICK